MEESLFRRMPAPLFVALAVALCLGSGATGAAAPALDDPWVDNFDGPPLNPRWWWGNEQPDYWSLTARPGFLRIMTLPGSPIKNLLYQDAPSGGFEITARVQLAPSRTFQRAGLIVRESPQNNLHLVRAYCDDPDIIYCRGDAIYFDKNVAGGDRLMQSLSPWPHTDTYLRLRKLGSNYTGYASTDGANWVLVGSWTVTEWSPNAIGLHAAGLSDDPDPAAVIPADFDFFRLDLLPRLYLPLVMR